MKRYLILLGVLLYCIMLKAQTETYSCRYWFDQNHVQAVTVSFNDSIWQTALDVGQLSEGFHSLHLQVADTTMHWSSPQTFMFFKIAETLQESLICHYWFDQDYEQMRHLPFGNGHLFLDVSGLEDGIHTVNVLLEGENITTTQNYSFVKVAIEDPSTECQYHCWFDNDYSTMQTGSIGTGIFELEVEGLSNGIHTVYVQIDNGTLSVPQCYMFYKRPVGGYIAKWEYWLNGNTNNRHTTNLSPCTDSLSIITLLPMETQPIRSSCFHFQPNGDEPYINAKNEITLRFWDALGHFIDKSSFYIDDQVQQSVVADIIERNATETIAVPGDNQIQWFKLDAGRGDYLSFKADKACTMQLFAPSGEEVYTASGPESIMMEGFNVWEDGIYYLAVHDVMGSGETVSITYNWLNRYAIVSYDVHLVGNGGCSTITFQGNGFNSLLDAYLVNWQNDTIRSLDIGHESNTTTTVSLNFYQENLGVYDAVFEFFEETIRINGALEVQEPVDILLTSSVSYPSRFLRNTPCTYTYTITNNGNMSAYAVPIFVYIATPTLDGISHLEFDGLDLPSIVDNMNLDSLSPSQIAELKEWEKEVGDEHYFCLLQTIDDETGDTIITRCNYFFINLAPFETKTLKLETTSNEPIDVWMTIPNEIIQPLAINSVRGLNQYCCVVEKIGCYATITSTVLNWASLCADAAGLAALAFAQPEVTVTLLTWGGALTIASCIASIIQDKMVDISEVVCSSSGDIDIVAYLKLALLLKTPYAHYSWGTVLSCIPVLNLKNGIRVTKEAFKFLKKAYLKQTFEYTTDIGALVASEFHCLKEYHNKWPNCPPGNHKGGKSNAVNSIDPNDIHGYLSESGSHYMRQEIQNVQYEIEFENDTTLATAAAHTIIVRDTLDATKFDLNSLAARSVTIGDKRLDLNGEQIFAKTLDLRPEIYVIAQVEQDYDPTTGIIQWTIQSLDPMTMEPTDDPYQGVLPVNYYSNGVGFIDYSIDIKEAFADGTVINNRAGIIFDQNDVILTPTWTNIVDAVKPTSHIEEVTVDADTLNFIFASEDNRSGVWYHTLYYRNAATEMEWKVKKAQIFENNYLLVNNEPMTTEFLVMATDSAGNREEKDMLAEYTYLYDGPGQIAQNNTLAQGWNWWSTYIEQNGHDGLADLENGLGHKGLTIKSQNEFVDNYYQYMDEDYWYGSLESITNEQGYVLNVTEDCNFTLSGTKAMPANHPITIHPNWNWIGYPVVAPQTVTAAMDNFNPSGDDVIKSQTDYAFYYDGYGWFPDDFVLVPGSGYKYQSNATANKTLSYSNGNRGGSATPKTESHHWAMDSHAFADNLNVIAVVIIDNVEQRNENLELGAFVNGVCRGSAQLRHFGPSDRYYAMLTVSGLDGERIDFGYIDTETEQNDMNAENHITFVQDAVMGKLDKPFEVRFNTASQVQSYVEHYLTIYPNPVEKDQSFALEIPRDEVVTEITVTDMLGAVVRHESGAVNVRAIKGLPTSGVYLIELVAESGNVYRGRLIVK